MNDSVVVPQVPPPSVEHFAPDSKEYETLTFVTENEFVDHFSQSALEAQEFMHKLTQNRPMTKKEVKHFKRDIRIVAKESYRKQIKDEKGNVVLKLPKMKRVEEGEGGLTEPKEDTTVTDRLSVYLLTRRQTAHFRGECCNGELFPDFVNDYLNDMRWVFEIGKMDNNHLFCLFCQKEIGEDEKEALVMKKVSARMESELVEAKCWLTCPHCDDKIPVWDGEEEQYKERGLRSNKDLSDKTFVSWGKRRIDVVIPTQTIYFTTGAPQKSEASGL
jgi:hypothetical protein